MWFYAIWWITAQKTGVSALDLQKDIGLGSYRSAWLLLHKIRSAMIQADRGLLQGDIELDITELKAGGGQWVAVAAEFSGNKRIGRIRIEKIKDASPWGLECFLLANIAKEATLHTSGAIGAVDINKLEFKQILSISNRDALPRVLLVSDLLNRWLKGTLHGRFDPKHLSSYLEEFVFRFNRRTAKSRGLLFQRVMENAVRVPPAPYLKIVARHS